VTLQASRETILLRCDRPRCSLGTLAEALGLYVLLVAGTNILPRSWRFQRWKLWMRIELALWWVVFAVGDRDLLHLVRNAAVALKTSVHDPLALSNSLRIALHRRKSRNVRIIGNKTKREAV
jgi:hypothetical protein